MEDDLDKIIQLMRKLVTGYSPSMKIVDLFYNEELRK